jgi:YVTN family beta-propeller protein
MWFSPSGKWIYLRKNHQTPGHDDVYLAVFDTARNRFLPARAHLGGGNCFSAQVMPTMNDLTVDVTCLRSASEIVFDEDREAVTETAIWTSPDNEPPLAGAVRASTGQVNFLLREAIPGRLIDRFQALVAHGGDSFYFATRPRQYPGALFADEIVQADAETLTPRATIKTPEPFRAICLSYDRSSIYAVSPETSSITVIDAKTLTVSGTVKPVGRAPSFVIPAPE